MAPSDAGPTELCCPDPGASRPEVLGRRVRCLTGPLGSTAEGPLLGKTSSPRGPGCASARAHGSERNGRCIHVLPWNPDGGHLHTPRTHRVPSSCPHRHAPAGSECRCTRPAALLSSGGLAERPLLCARETPGHQHRSLSGTRAVGGRGRAAVGSLRVWRIPGPPQATRVCSPGLGHREGPGVPGGRGLQLGLPYERSSESHTRQPCWEQPPPAQGFLPREQEG